ncbi:rab11 family-interacting protein 4a-like protein [Lasius niger]|uniref:Rab11 family-interacting protein 4a-like protein n=1 Tax=Lasius niger TaxID=67767 RepID=A0A0J7L2L1_LASNI|nr:rab11 family-interacting protein 4a-like protein [Lasius niger]
MVSSRTPDANVITSSADGGAAANGGAVDGSRATTNGVDREWSQSSGPASLPMSTDLRNLVISHLSDSGRYSSTSPDRHRHQETAVTTTGDDVVAAIKIGCHDEEESYEGFGSVEGDSVDDGPDSPGGSSSAPSPTGTNSRR